MENLKNEIIVISDDEELPMESNIKRNNVTTGYDSFIEISDDENEPVTKKSKTNKTAMNLLSMEMKKRQSSSNLSALFIVPNHSSISKRSKNKSRRKWEKATTTTPFGQEWIESAKKYAQHLEENWIEGTELGSGAYGTVFKVRNKTTGELRAMKRVTLQTNTFQKQIHSAFSEVEILKSLNHPNIVRIYDYCITTNCVYLKIFMEYVSKGTLRTAIRSKINFPEYTIRKYARELLTAVAFLHSNNVVHRDVKPENILVTEEDNLKLADFGISKILHDVSCCSSIVGTTQYCSKEIMEGKYNRKTDVWSVGCVLLELSTGQPPWPHRHPAATACAISLGKTPTIPELASGVFKEFLAKTFLSEIERPSANELMNMPWIKHGFYDICSQLAKK